MHSQIEQETTLHNAINEIRFPIVYLAFIYGGSCCRWLLANLSKISGFFSRLIFKDVLLSVGKVGDFDFRDRQNRCPPTIFVVNLIFAQNACFLKNGLGDIPK